MRYNLACERLRTLHLVADIALHADERERLDSLIIDTEQDVARLRPPPSEIRYVPTAETPDVPIDVCVFCRCHRQDVAGQPCASFQAAHEFRAAPPAPPVQTKRLDLNLCTKCKLHKKNPASATSDCQHTYPEAP
jgi:hypothetical protein